MLDLASCPPPRKRDSFYPGRGQSIPEVFNGKGEASTSDRKPTSGHTTEEADAGKRDLGQSSMRDQDEGVGETTSSDDTTDCETDETQTAKDESDESSLYLWPPGSWKEYYSNASPQVSSQPRCQFLHENGGPFQVLGRL